MYQLYRSRRFVLAFATAATALALAGAAEAPGAEHGVCGRSQIGAGHAEIQPFQAEPMSPLDSTASSAISTPGRVRSRGSRPPRMLWMRL
jgi:hypothetical protein